MGAFFVTGVRGNQSHHENALTWLLAKNAPGVGGAWLTNRAPQVDDENAANDNSDVNCNNYNNSSSNKEEDEEKDYVGL